MFEEFTNISDLNRLHWEAINSDNWQEVRGYKQAEFLMESHFPWNLIETIGVYSQQEANHVNSILSRVPSRPHVIIKPEWYY